MLTDRTKHKFIEWYLDNYGDTKYKSMFDELPLSMKYGILVDFFDSLKITINECSIKNGVVTYLPQILRKHSYPSNVGIFSDRETSREESIKKADIIYNEFYKRLT